MFPCLPRISCDTILDGGGKTTTIHARALFPCASLPTLYNEFGNSQFVVGVCVRYVIPYLQEDRDNTMRPNPHNIWRSIFLEWCHRMYGVNPRTRNHHFLVQPLSTLKHVGCKTSPMSSNKNPLTNHRSAYMHYTSLPLAIKIGSWHTSLNLDICHCYRNSTTHCTWTWQLSIRSSKRKTLKSSKSKTLNQTKEIIKNQAKP